MIELITLSKSRKEGGAVAIVVAIVIFLLLGFGALSLDIAHLCVAQGELRNASDAGALAGALFLYNIDGTLVNEGANQIAFDAATENKSEKVAVEVNEGDIERGHWT
jgi:Flp pilus assembly protein TadG